MPAKLKGENKMAKNWTIKEAYEALKSENKAAVMDFGKRFPIATMAVSKLSGAEMLMSGLPDHMTMRKLDMALKDGVEPLADEEPTEKKEAPKKANTGGKRGRPSKSETKVKESEAKEAEAEAEYDGKYDDMSAVELFKLCKKRGITAQPKQKSKVYIDLLKAADAKIKAEEEEPAPKKSAKSSAKAAKKSEPVDDDSDWDI